MSYNLFLDDLRFPEDVKWVKLPSVQWEIVRDYNQFVEIIQKKGVPRMVSFDHDLADEHYKEFFACNKEGVINKGKIRYEKLTEKTGYHCAMWLSQFCVDKGLPLPLYYLHSMNGPGCQNIFSVMESARKVIDGE